MVSGVEVTAVFIVKRTGDHPELCSLCYLVINAITSYYLSDETLILYYVYFLITKIN